MAAPKIKYSRSDPSRVTWLEKKDLYKRACGCWPDEATPKVFYLGSDENVAKARALKLDQLWREFAAAGAKTWTVETLEAALAVAKGKKRLELEPIRISSISLDGQSNMQVAEDSLNEARVEALRNNTIPVVVAQPAQRLVRTGASLHATIDAYANFIRKTTLTPGTQQTSPHGFSSAHAIERLKNSHPDCPMAQVSYTVIEEMTRHWTSRPARKGTSKPISLDTVDNQVGVLRRFLKWASRHAGYRKPEDWIDATRYQRKLLATEDEIAAKATPRQVKTYTIPELEIIWGYTTRWERTLLALALNCAFAAAEENSLRFNEVVEVDGETYVKRIRKKSSVYGEHVLWPETIELLNWAKARRQEIAKASNEKLKPTDFILVRETGERLVNYTEAGNRTDNASDSWKDVVKKIRQDHPAFRYIPFKDWRKTASNLLKKVSDGETAGVFLHHGQSVAGDELADIYTDRDFDKVFAAQRKVRALLAGMFAKPVWSRGEDRREEVRRMKAEGLEPKEIAKQLHASLATVYRHLGD